jgi:hypothetical protein
MNKEIVTHFSLGAIGLSDCRLIQDLVETTIDDPPKSEDYTDLINEIFQNSKTADQESFIIHQVTALYVYISRKYVTEELAAIPRIYGMDQAELEQERSRLIAWIDCSTRTQLNCKVTTCFHWPAG